jgi:hypothetical protein
MRELIAQLVPRPLGECLDCRPLALVAVLVGPDVGRRRGSEIRNRGGFPLNCHYIIASRFARDLVAQELGLLLLIKRDVRVLTASGDDLTETADPSRVMMRQIAGSFSQYEKARLVLKLRGARERIRETQGKCEGRKSYVERDPELVLAAKRLHRRSPKGHRRSLRDIARELQAMGYSNNRGAPYSASCVKSMVEGPKPSATRASLR